MALKRTENMVKVEEKISENFEIGVGLRHGDYQQFHPGKGIQGRKCK